MMGVTDKGHSQPPRADGRMPTKTPEYTSRYSAESHPISFLLSFPETATLRVVQTHKPPRPLQACCAQLCRLRPAQPRPHGNVSLGVVQHSSPDPSSS